MSHAEKVLVPSRHYEAGDAQGLLSAFDPGTRTLPAGFRIDPRFRDGVRIYVDVLRPAGTEKVPVIVAWSPYGKSQGTAPFVTSLFGMIGLDNSVVSGLEKFEGPDPAYWCAQGYAICNPDPRGIAHSEGDSAMFGRQEGRDCLVAEAQRYPLVNDLWEDKTAQFEKIKPAGEFPPEEVAYAVAAVYDSGSKTGLVSFTVRFSEETVMVGYAKARLWVEAKGADDMDLFVLVQKLDANGSHLQRFNIPNQGAMMQDLTERGASVLRYKGSNGRLRVSARHRDETLSTDFLPAHSFDRVEKLQPGEIVDVEIDLFPIGMVFYPGEQLRLVISAQNAPGAIMPAVPDYISQNSGQHVIHTGGSHASYLQLPIKAATEPQA